VLFMNTMMSHAAFLLGAFQIFFVVNLFMSITRGRAATTNPWEATTMEWATPTPPLAHGNFEEAPRAYRSPYEYSIPGASADFLPQHVSDHLATESRSHGA
jgi:cytochrome c oxidase subunit I